MELRKRALVGQAHRQHGQLQHHRQWLRQQGSMELRSKPDRQRLLSHRLKPLHKGVHMAQKCAQGAHKHRSKHKAQVQEQEQTHKLQATQPSKGYLARFLVQPRSWQQLGSQHRPKQLQQLQQQCHWMMRTARHSCMAHPQQRQQREDGKQLPQQPPGRMEQQ